MKKMSLMLIVIMTLWGCVTFSHTYKSGVQAAISKDWDKAVELYEKALEENPQNSVYRMALQRAKVSASLFHLYAARQLVRMDKKEISHTLLMPPLFDPNWQTGGQRTGGKDWPTP